MITRFLRYILPILSFLLMVVWACDNEDSNHPEEEKTAADSFAKGADVGWITEMETAGYQFYDSNGVQRECMALLKSLGMNAIRLRTWVNPEDGWCGKEDLLIKAWRAKNLGMRIMIDFHYSNEWADPGDQHKPTTWEGISLAALTDSLYNYTVEVLKMLKKYEIEPEWVQIGNETTGGMLWDDVDSISGGLTVNNGANYTQLHNAGYDAAKSVFPNTKVVLHIDRGQRNDLTQRLFSYMVPNGAKLDILGLSLYPDPDEWQTYTESCVANMQWVVDNYDLDVMICEVGMSWDEAATAKEFLTELIAETRSIKDASDNVRGKGVFYWEPES